MTFPVGSPIPIRYYHGVSGATVLCRPINESDGLHGAELTLVESATLLADSRPGWYEGTFTPNAAGHWKLALEVGGVRYGNIWYWVSGTALGANKSLVDILGSDGVSLLSHDYNDLSILGFLLGSHLESVILFVIPEAIGAINANNTAIQAELDKFGEVVPITQADALEYPDFNSITLIVLGSNSSVAWNLANLADIKTIPNVPVLCVDSDAAAELEIGTDGGDAAAKTVLNAVANIEGSILGAGLHDQTGLAAGANTIAAAGVTFNTLDMSDAQLTETWFAYESVNANTDVILGFVRRIQTDGTIGIDEDGAEVSKDYAFYGPGYSFDGLNTLGQATFHLIASILIHGRTIGQAITISGNIGNLSTKLFGNMTSQVNASNPMAAFVMGNTGGTGTELPNSISLYDVVKALSYLAGTGTPTADSFLDYIMNKDGGQTFDRTTDSLEAIRELCDLLATAAALGIVDGYHDVAAGDSANNTVMRDIIGNKADTAAAAINATSSIMRYVKMLVTDWLNGGRLDLILDIIAADVIETRAGNSQVLAVSITDPLNNGVTVVATVGTAPVIIDSIVLHADTAAHADMTTCAVEGGVGQVVEFIGAGEAVEANLDAADKQVFWAAGAVRLAVGKTITIDLQGVGANAADLTVTITYHAEADGGVLA